MLDIFVRLSITIVQLGLIHFIFTNIELGDSEKANEKIALKNYLHGFLIYIIGFNMVMSIVSRFFGFPKELQMTLFFIGLIIITIVWIYENRNMILENIKYTKFGEILGNQFKIVKETIVSDPMLSDKYPFHFYEPTSNLGVISKEEYILQKDTGAKLVIERS